RNAVNFSSARTMKRVPSTRCASAIQIIRPCGSTADTQPQLQPALLRLSARISQWRAQRILIAAVLRRKEGFARKRIFYFGSWQKTRDDNVTAVWRERTGH